MSKAVYVLGTQLDSQRGTAPTTTDSAAACVGVWVLGFRVQGFGFRIQRWNSGYRIRVCRVENLGSRVEDSGFRVEDSGLRIQGLQVMV